MVERSSSLIVDLPRGTPGTKRQSSPIAKISSQLDLHHYNHNLNSVLDGLNDKSFLSRESSVYTALAKSHAQLEGYKKQLQNDVAIMRYGQGTRHVESYYEKKMHDLYAEIRLLARRIMPLREELTPELFESFKIALSGFPEGKETVKVMSSSGAGDCYALFCRNRSRGNMFMHLLSLTLYRRVLTPFAFGIDEVVTDTLHELQEIILDQGCLFLSASLLISRNRVRQGSHSTPIPWRSQLQISRPPKKTNSGASIKQPNLRPLNP